MTSRLKADDSPSRCIRRIVKGQIDKALGRLDDPGGSGSEDAVHDARKRLKKARALIRLARGGLGRKLADAVDALLRDAGRPLSGVRDACVLVETFDGLIGRFGPGESPEATGRIREALLERGRSIARRAIDEGDCLQEVARRLELARKVLKRRKPEGDGWGDLRKGVRRIYRDGSRAAGPPPSAPPTSFCTNGGSG